MHNTTINYEELENIIADLQEKCNSREKDLQILKTREELENRLSELEAEIEKLKNEAEAEEESREFAEERSKDIEKKKKELSFVEAWGTPIAYKPDEKKMLELYPSMSLDNAKMLCKNSRIVELEAEVNKINYSMGKLSACRYGVNDNYKTLIKRV